ncbi:MAG: hypothetical protein LBU79_08280 [Planctomycetota bacterium]|jgi:hypothetical protein|nr:hypothetical protein [Planctomycetota bacterium]
MSRKKLGQIVLVLAFLLAGLKGELEGVEVTGTRFETIGQGRAEARAGWGDFLRSLWNREVDDQAAQGRGIDYSDVKWRRQARMTGIHLRMLNGPEGELVGDFYSSEAEQIWRETAGITLPLNNRWELAAFASLGQFSLRQESGDAGLESLRLRLGVNPSRKLRPWFALNPYRGTRDSKAMGLGMEAGVQNTWRLLWLSGRVFAWEPWVDGYQTLVEDGRRHGVELMSTLPISRRLSLTGSASHTWLETGPRARSGRAKVGRQYGWSARFDYIALKRDGANMGEGFREANLWGEDTVPTELGFYGQVSGQRYYRAPGFTTFDMEPRVLDERLGLRASVAVSPHIGVSGDAYVGRDPKRRIAWRDLYGYRFDLNLVVDEHLRFWGGWGYENASSALAAGGGGASRLTFGLDYNF